MRFIQNKRVRVRVCKICSRVDSCKCVECCGIRKVLHKQAVIVFHRRACRGRYDCQSAVSDVCTLISCASRSVRRRAVYIALRAVYEIVACVYAADIVKVDILSETAYPAAVRLLLSIPYIAYRCAYRSKVCRIVFRHLPFKARVYRRYLVYVIV